MLMPVLMLSRFSSWEKLFRAKLEQLHSTVTVLQCPAQNFNSLIGAALADVRLYSLFGWTWMFCAEQRPPFPTLAVLSSSADFNQATPSSSPVCLPAARPPAFVSVFDARCIIILSRLLSLLNQRVVETVSAFVILLTVFVTLFEVATPNYGCSRTKPRVVLP